MNLLVKIALTLIVLGVAYFALARIWTKEIDLLALLKKPSETIPVKEPAVVVIPSALDFATSDWGKTQLVEIRNTKTAGTVYSVWIKLKPETPALRPKEIEILSDTGEEFISETVGGINVNFDLVKIEALDQEKQPCTYLLIYKLQGLESRFFKLRRKSSKDKEEPLMLSLKVMGFSENPAPIATNDRGAALQFKPPENMTLRGLSMLMKKTP